MMIAKRWPDVLVVLGVWLFVYAFSGFSGSETGGSWEISYGRSDRQAMTAGAVLWAVGILARGRRSSAGKAADS